MIFWRVGTFAFLSICLVGTAQSPLGIDVPAGEKLTLQARGEGSQVYTCAVKGDVWSWTLKGPDAKLLDASGKAIGKHFAGPKWRLDDGSEVQGKLVASEAHPDTIPWLLLSATSTGASGKLSSVDTVRRTETQGGVAPATGCDASGAGKEVRVSYSATYSFYHSER